MTSENLAAREVPPFAPSRPVRAAWWTKLALPLLPARAHAAVPFAIGGVWALAIRHVNLDAMTDLGLVSVLPRVAILLLLLLTVSFCLALTRRPLSPMVPLIHVLVLVVILYGVTGILEPVPRFGSAWKIVGIIDYIARHGSSNPHIDAFFNWPGLTALGALITKVVGFDSALPIAGWAPLFFNLLFLAPLAMIFRWASDDPRVTWLGLWIFYSTNWVGQDYISNQAMAYVLWLSMLAALLTWFTPRPSNLFAHASLRRLTRAESGTLRLRRAVLLLLIVAMYVGIVTGHQLTPFPVILTVSGLVLFARLETRFLPPVMIVLLGAWIAYMTTAYLVGHSSALTGSFGQVSGNLEHGVSRRVSGSHGHELIVKIRVFATLAIWLLAAWGVLRRRLAGHSDVAMVIVAGVPFLLPALQSYSGEIFLRVFLFSLPAVSWFIATLAFPSRRAGRTWLTVAGVGTMACVLVVAFQYTRYGNERLDYFTKADYATVQAFYRSAPIGSTVYAGYENLPWRNRAYAAYRYRAVTDLHEWKEAPFDARKLAVHLRARLASSGGGYVLITRSTQIAVAMFENNQHALEALLVALRPLPHVQVVYRNEDGGKVDELLYVPPEGRTPARTGKLRRERGGASARTRSPSLSARCLQLRRRAPCR